MGLDHAYESLHKQVEDLEFKVRDAIDDHHHHTAESLKENLEHLENDIQRSKHPRDLENRIKTIQSELLEARSTERGYMSIPDADHFHRVFEDMRRTVRSLPNY